MSVTYDSLSGAASGFASGNTFPHTCSGAERLLLAWVYGDRGAASSYTVTSLTYAGTTLTQAGTWNNGVAWGELWYLIAPATGANNVISTYTTSACKHVIRCTSWNGAAQDTPLGTLVTATGSSTTAITVDAASAVGELVADCTAIRTVGLTITPHASQTLIENLTSTGGAFGAVGMSVEAGAASVTMSWTVSAGDDWLIGAVPIKPAASGAAGVPKTTKLTMLGVG